MRNLRVAAVFAVVLASGCGGGKAAKTTPADPADEAADCEPGRCLADVSARVVDHRPEARACYEEGVKRIPDMQGRIIINFEIDPDGKVLDASQSAQDEQIMDEQVVRCVENVVRAITFARSEKGKTTRAFHRFEFVP
jgi:hypothetical protein